MRIRARDKKKKKIKRAWAVNSLGLESLNQLLPDPTQPNPARPEKGSSFVVSRQAKSNVVDK